MSIPEPIEPSRSAPTSVREKARGRSSSSSSAVAKYDWLIGILLIVATFVAYQPAWKGTPLWDDDGHLTKPELQSVGGLIRIWFDVGATQQYYPVVHSVFWLEHRLFGDVPQGYHLVNILLHGFAAFLLLKLLRRLAVPGAELAAGIFALHPVFVESVAWISELKNTLSGVCYLSAALAYLEFASTRNKKAYAFAFFLFLFGLLSKSVIATLPAAMLVLFWWKRGKVQFRQDVFPLVPFFSIGIAAGLFTAWVERHFIGASGKEFAFTFVERCLIAGRALWFYLGKLVWPDKLIFIYPRWTISQSDAWQYVFPIAAIVLLGIAWAYRRHHRGPLAGLLFFGGTLFPALGFFNVYPFIYSFVADHFQYLASLGVITVFSAGIAVSLQKRRMWGEGVGFTICIVLLLGLGNLTWRQSRMYTNVETLWRTTLKRNPNCPMAYNNLGNFLLRKGEVSEALENFEAALRLQPDYVDARYSLGAALFEMHRVDEAVRCFEETLKLQPNHAKAHNNLGLALFQGGKLDDAIHHYQEALQSEPNHSNAHYNLGLALFQKRQMKEAVPHFEYLLAAQPEDAEVQLLLAFALSQSGESQKAVGHFHQVLRLQPDNSAALYNYAWLLATSEEASVRNGPEAVTLAERANQLSGGSRPEVLATLAAGLAEVGRFQDAVSTVQRAISMASAVGDAGMLKDFGAQLKAYEAGKPFRVSSKPATL